MKIRCDLTEARQFMATVEDRHDSLVAFLISAIDGALAQYNLQERLSLGTTAATQPEIDTQAEFGFGIGEIGST